MSLAFDFEESLISEVRHSPTLYDHNRGEYRDQEKVEDAWKKIASKLNASLRECKTRWKSLRDTYVRKLRAAQRNPVLFEEKKKWRYLDQMSFLDGFLKIPVGNNSSSPALKAEPNNCDGLHADKDDGSNEKRDSTPEPNTSVNDNATTPLNKKLVSASLRKRKIVPGNAPEFDKFDFKRLCHELMENKRVLDAFSTERDDECLLFGRQVSLMLKKITGLERYTAQIEIMEVLMARMPSSESTH